MSIGASCQVGATIAASSGDGKPRPPAKLAHMGRCIAFLRAVNVGGRTVRMAALRDEFEALGFTGVETFIASGNVIFETRARDLAALERKIEARLNVAFGFEIDTFIRGVDELAAIANHPAFDAAEVASARTFVVGFLASAPDTAALQTIAGFNTEDDRFHVHGRELYWLSHQRQSESKFSNAVFERSLRMRSTFRGIATLHRLNSKLAAP
jgi:uncharacterized protein (DUF1697 family)